MRRLTFHFFLWIALALSISFTSRAGEIIEGDTADAMVTADAVNNQAYDTYQDLGVGQIPCFNGVGAMIGTLVEGFALPYLAPGQQVTGATVSFYLEQVNSTPSYNIQLYALNRTSTTSSVPLVSDFYNGANDTANVLLVPQFVTPQSAGGQAYTFSGSSLVSFIQQKYASTAFSSIPFSSSRFVFFRLSPDSVLSPLNNVDYQFASARHPNRAYHPTLSLTISNGITNTAGRLQFSFSLPQAAVTSAGVYNPSTGAMIRTLWNNVQYQQGTNYGVWDGNDDSGNPVPTGSNYQIKLIYHNVQYVWEGIIGNTSASQTGAHVYRAFNYMSDMSIAGNVASYAVGYNEGQNPFHTFTVGAPQVPNEVQSGFADPFAAFSVVTSDATRSYWAKGTGGLTGAADTYVIAANKSDGSFYTFPQGSTPSGSGQKYPSCVDLDTTANQPNPATGLAVQQSGNALFVSHGNLNLVRVFDKVQGTSLGSFAVTNPGRMSTTANGDVWVISNASTPVVQRYTFAGGKATLKQTITGLVNPIGLCVSADDSLLLVADSGTSQQVKAFNNTTGASVWTYGTLGGMAVNGPTINTNTFEFNTQVANYNTFINQTFIAFQSDNTFWMGDGGNGRVLHFSINGNTLVYIEQIAYTDISYQSTVDVTDATRVFNMFTEFSVNYALPPGGTNGSWTMTKNWAYGLPSDSTHNYFGYCNGFNNVVTLSNGHTYGFLNNFSTGNWDLFELSANGPARATGYAYNTNPRMYPDGTLRFNITTSTTLSFYSQPLTGFDAKNNPVWGSPALVATTPLAATDPKTWSTYPERTEITAGGTVVDYDPNQADTGYHMGGIAVGGTAWQWRSAPSTASNYTGWFPQDGRFDIGNGVQYAGDIIMGLGRNVVCGYHGEFWKQSEACQWVNFFDNGLMVGRFGILGVDGGSDASYAGISGNAFAPTLVHGPNGKVYLYHNDESSHGGTIRWRIDGWDGITELKGTAAIGATANLSPTTTGPTVGITSPTAGAVYVNGTSLTLSVEAASSGASITSVQFFDGSTSLGTVTSAPFNLNYSGLSVGSHVITAKATDSAGLSATSASVSIIIGADGSNTPPPAPVSLSSGTITSQGVPLTWIAGASGTSSTIGSIISFQFDASNDSKVMTPSMVAGAPSYAVANFNVEPLQSTNGLTFINPLNSAGAVVANLGLNIQAVLSNDNGSVQSLPGTAQNVFAAEITTAYNTATAISVSNVPYGLYDLVVYSLPGNVSSSSPSNPQTASVTVSDGLNVSAVQQSFTAPQTGYNVSTVAFGSSSSVTNANTVVIQGLTSPSFKLQGANIASFQIVERPYNQGVPTTYNIERALGTGGTFALVNSVPGTALSFTDTTALTPSTTYQYRVKAVNSFGSSSYSNIVSITTPSGTTTSTASSNFASWQSLYFNSGQLADPTISGPAADPYGSGVPNLLAYALQLNPATAQATDVPHAVVSNGHLTLTYLSPSSISDITYVVEVSSDMINWNSGPGFTQVISTVTSANGATITVQDALPTSTQKHFMRLRVTQNP